MHKDAYLSFANALLLENDSTKQINGQNRLLDGALTQSGDVRDWQTVRRLPRTHSLVTTRLQLEDGRVIEIRKPSLPDAEQALVYARLGIDWKQGCHPYRDGDRYSAESLKVLD
jgi:hypothetical protein